MAGNERTIPYATDPVYGPVKEPGPEYARLRCADFAANAATRAPMMSLPRARWTGPGR
jgi:hypothetical protein